MQIAVIGRIQTRNYDDKDGKKIYVTEVIAEEVYFAETKKEATYDNGPFENATSTITDDDLPF